MKKRTYTANKKKFVVRNLRVRTGKDRCFGIDRKTQRSDTVINS